MTNRFQFLNTFYADDPNGNQQAIVVYWDNKTGVPIALDASFVEQCDSFNHPYHDEVIVFDDYIDQF